MQILGPIIGLIIGIIGGFFSSMFVPKNVYKVNTPIQKITAGTFHSLVINIFSITVFISLVYYIIQYANWSENAKYGIIASFYGAGIAMVIISAAKNFIKFTSVKLSYGATNTLPFDLSGLLTTVSKNSNILEEYDSYWKFKHGLVKSYFESKDESVKVFSLKNKSATWINPHDPQSIKIDFI